MFHTHDSTAGGPALEAPSHAHPKPARLATQHHHQHPSSSRHCVCLGGKGADFVSYTQRAAPALEAPSCAHPKPTRQPTTQSGLSALPTNAAPLPIMLACVSTARWSTTHQLKCCSHASTGRAAPLVRGAMRKLSEQPLRSPPQLPVVGIARSRPGRAILGPPCTIQATAWPCFAVLPTTPTMLIAAFTA